MVRFSPNVSGSAEWIVTFPDPPVAAYVPPLGFKDTDHAVRRRKIGQTFSNYGDMMHWTLGLTRFCVRMRITLMFANDRATFQVP
jgi:hypothetical protein